MLNCILQFSGKTKVIIDETQMAELVNVESIKKQMENAVSQMKEGFMKYLSLRSSAGILSFKPLYLLFS